MIDWLFFTTFHAVRIAESEEDEGNKTKIYDILHLVQILSILSNIVILEKNICIKKKLIFISQKHWMAMT